MAELAPAESAHEPALFFFGVFGGNNKWGNRSYYKIQGFEIFFFVLGGVEDCKMGEMKGA